jgi:hypothetical protein
MSCRSWALTPDGDMFCGGRRCCNGEPRCQELRVGRGRNYDVVVMYAAWARVGEGVDTGGRVSTSGGGGGGFVARDASALDKANWCTCGLELST